MNDILYDALFENQLKISNINFTTDTDILWSNFSLSKRHATGEITAKGFFSLEMETAARRLIAARLLKSP